jgi:hypothetical protein
LHLYLHTQYKAPRIDPAGGLIDRQFVSPNPCTHKYMYIHTYIYIHVLYHLDGTRLVPNNLGKQYRLSIQLSVRVRAESFRMAVMSWLGSSGFVGASLFANATPSTTATAALVTVTLIALTTRLFCSFLKSQKGKDGAWSVGMVPYWIPFLGHIPALAVNQEAFLRKLRSVSPAELTSLDILRMADIA